MTLICRFCETESVSFTSVPPGNYYEYEHSLSAKNYIHTVSVTSLANVRHYTKESSGEHSTGQIYI